MSSTLLPLPLFLLVPRGIEHIAVSRAVIPCMDAQGGLVARVVCEPQNERTLLGFIPTYDGTTVSVLRCDEDEERLVAQGTFRTSLSGFRGPPLQLRSASDDLYDAVADGYEVDPLVRAEDGAAIGTVGMLHLLSNAFEVRNASGSMICVARVLPQHRCRTFRFERPRGTVVVGFEEGDGRIDARLLVAWLYRLSMRALSR